MTGFGDNIFDTVHLLNLEERNMAPSYKKIGTDDSRWFVNDKKRQICAGT